MKLHIGFGFDTHRLVENRDLVLGGVKLDYHLGLLGHSDADVLTHAIIDAMLGAANLHDIGYYFPDTDPQYKNINSIELLKKTNQLIHENHWEIVNIDSTIVLQKPKLLPYIDDIKKNISHALEISKEDISVKAKTSEQLGFIGREEGCSAYATILLNQF